MEPLSGKTSRHVEYVHYINVVVWVGGEYSYVTINSVVPVTGTWEVVIPVVVGIVVRVIVGGTSVIVVCVVVARFIPSVVTVDVGVVELRVIVAIVYAVGVGSIGAFFGVGIKQGVVVDIYLIVGKTAEKTHCVSS